MTRGQQHEPRPRSEEFTALTEGLVMRTERKDQSIVTEGYKRASKTLRRPWQTQQAWTLGWKVVDAEISRRLVAALAKFCRTLNSS